MLSEQFHRLVEASPVEVQVLARDPELAPAASLYARVLAAHLSGDVARLKELVDGAPEGTDADLLAVARLRLAFRQRKLSRELLESACARSSEARGVFKAETEFVAGLGWEQLGDDQKSHEWFLAAASTYQKLGCPKRRLRAFYNSIAAESRIKPYKNFVLEYQAVVRLSQELGDLSFAGIAQTMISREFQILGLTEKALAHAEESVANLSPEMGSLHYSLALLQKAHLLISLGRAAEAQCALKETELSSFAEVRAVRRLLECALDPKLEWDSQWEKDLIPTWKERLPELLALAGRSEPGSPQQPLAALEAKVLKLLWSGPLAKWDLIENLYPDIQDSTLLENRFKNLVGRIRKKYPGLLEQNEGRYFVTGKNKPDLCEMVGLSP